MQQLIANGKHYDAAKLGTSAAPLVLNALEKSSGPQNGQSNVRLDSAEVGQFRAAFNHLINEFGAQLTERDLERLAKIPDFSYYGLIREDSWSENTQSYGDRYRQGWVDVEMNEVRTKARELLGRRP